MTAQGSGPSYERSLSILGSPVTSSFYGAKCYLGKVKPQDNVSQWSLDLGGLGWSCKFSWGAIYRTSCLHLSTTVSSAICFALSLPAVLLCNPFCPLHPSLEVCKYFTERFSVMVPSGGRSQGCHGYLLSEPNVSWLLPTHGTNA